MPYPNEHAARLRDPDSFSDDAIWSDGRGGKFRRGKGGTIYGSIKVPATVSVIWGKLPGRDGKNDSSVPQALRFPTTSWTVSEARAWLKEQKVKTVSFEPASGQTEASMIVVSLAGPFELVEDTERPDGKTRNLFWKELLREGHWIHPTTGQELNFTRRQLERWAEMHGVTLAAGIKCPIVADHSMRVEDGHGFCIKTETREKVYQGQKILSLWGLLSVGDDYAKKIGQGDIEDVSVGILDRPDGHGGVFKSVLHHIALTLYPVIEDQEGFIRLAAYGYDGPVKPEKRRKRRERGDVKMNRRRKPEPQIPEEITVQLSALQDEVKGLKLSIQEKDEAIKQRDEKLAEHAKAEADQSKGIFLSAVDALVSDKQAITPKAADELKEKAETLFQDASPEQAKAWQEILLAVVGAFKSGGIPAGTQTEGQDKEAKDKEGPDFTKNYLKSRGIPVNE